jgi:hypothetical protein
MFNNNIEERIPLEIARIIEKVSSKVKSLSEQASNFDPEKIYDSYVKVDEFRRDLYEIDVLSQNLMDAYKLYAVYAAQAMSQGEGTAQSDEPTQEAEDVVSS